MSRTSPSLAVIRSGGEFWRLDESRVMILVSIIVRPKENVARGCATTSWAVRLYSFLGTYLQEPPVTTTLTTTANDVESSYG